MLFIFLKIFLYTNSKDLATKYCFSFSQELGTMHVPLGFWLQGIIKLLGLLSYNIHSYKLQSNLALREIFVTAYLSLKVKFLLKSSFRNIISEPYISPTEKRKPFFPLSLSFPMLWFSECFRLGHGMYNVPLIM